MQMSYRYVTCRCGSCKLATFDAKRCQLSSVVLSVHLICLQHVPMMQRVARISQQQLILVDMTVYLNLQATYTFCTMRRRFSDDAFICCDHRCKKKNVCCVFNHGTFLYLKHFKFYIVFTARRSYASAVLGVVILSVRPSVCHTHAL